jgi:hypothetical protein
MPARAHIIQDSRTSCTIPSAPFLLHVTYSGDAKPYCSAYFQKLEDFLKKTLTS